MSDVALLGAAWYVLQKRKRKKARRWCVRPLHLGRKEKGALDYIRGLTADPEMFHNFYRMDKMKFDNLLEILTPYLTRKGTHSLSIGPLERLSITLRYLASGDMMTSVAKSFLIGKSTCSQIISETCNALWLALKSEIKTPTTPEEWRNVADGFWEKWNFPNCLGALDGKHIQIVAPANSGSFFFNYKGTFSMILLALVDANYKYVYVSVGSYGSTGDAAVFAASELANLLNQRNKLPPPAKLPGSDTTAEYTIIADDAFPLKPNLMKPYPGNQLTNRSKSIFNYRLTRARRVVENAFGITSARWRILRRPITASTSTVDRIVKAVVVLHNYLIDDQYYCPSSLMDSTPDTFDGEWRKMTQSDTGLKQLNRTGRNHSRVAFESREKFSRFFSAEGSVPWQDEMIQRGRKITE